jgi:hypothetical protein
MLLIFIFFICKNMSGAASAVNALADAEKKKKLKYSKKKEKKEMKRAAAATQELDSDAMDVVSEDESDQKQERSRQRVKVLTYDEIKRLYPSALVEPPVMPMSKVHLTSAQQLKIKNWLYTLFEKVFQDEKEGALNPIDLLPFDICFQLDETGSIDLNRDRTRDCFQFDYNARTTENKNRMIAFLIRNFQETNVTQFTKDELLEYIHNVFLDPFVSSSIIPWSVTRPTKVVMQGAAGGEASSSVARPTNGLMQGDADGVAPSTFWTSPSSSASHSSQSAGRQRVHVFTYDEIKNLYPDALQVPTVIPALKVPLESAKNIKKWFDTQLFPYVIEQELKGHNPTRIIPVDVCLQFKESTSYLTGNVDPTRDCFRLDQTSLKTENKNRMIAFVIRKFKEDKPTGFTEEELRVIINNEIDSGLNLVRHEELQALPCFSWYPEQKMVEIQDQNQFMTLLPDLITPDTSTPDSLLKSLYPKVTVKPQLFGTEKYIAGWIIQEYRNFPEYQNLPDYTIGANPLNLILKKCFQVEEATLKITENVDPSKDCFMLEESVRKHENKKRLTVFLIEQFKKFKVLMNTPGRPTYGKKLPFEEVDLLIFLKLHLDSKREYYYLFDMLGKRKPSSKSLKRRSKSLKRRSKSLKRRSKQRQCH